MNLDENKLFTLVIESLSDRKAINILAIDISGVSFVADYMIICTGTSSTHIKGIANGLTEKVKENNFTIYNIDGKESGEWVLVDLGTIIVNIMQSSLREYYKLEKLWSNGKVVFADENVLEKQNNN